jgi:ankyrin repeat protein
MTPLHFAVKHGCQDAVEVLLAHPNIRVDMTDFMGRYPLEFTSKEGYQPLERLILSHVFDHEDKYSKYIQEAALRKRRRQVGRVKTLEPT